MGLSVTLSAVSKAHITAELVRILIAEQFPDWGHLPVRRVELDGWDNATFRLGDGMSVRVPSADEYMRQVDKEQQWLPMLAPQLPVAIPVPLGRGAPTPMLARPWSVYRWIEGEPLRSDDVVDTVALAEDLAWFLAALHRCTPAGPAPGAHSFGRGGPVAAWNEQVEANFVALRDVIDVRAAREVWSAALTAEQTAAPVWVHGDITGSNLLVRDGRLTAVIDFGCCAFGDPACDLTIAWTFLRGEARDVFMERVPVDASAWARARGWALWKAMNHLVQDQAEPGQGRQADRRMGWRLNATDVIAEVVAD